MGPVNAVKLAPERGEKNAPAEDLDRPRRRAGTAADEVEQEEGANGKASPQAEVGRCEAGIGEDRGDIEGCQAERFRNRHAEMEPHPRSHGQNGGAEDGEEHPDLPILEHRSWPL